VKNLLVSEFGLKTSHPEFYKKAVTMLNERDKRGLKLFGVKISTQKSARRVEKECVLIENLIGEGFQNVRRTIQEYVTKIIANTLIDYLRENLEAQLVARLGKPEKIEEVMVDENLDQDLWVEREKTTKLLKVRFY
jgi:signal transduction histidine kinase